MTATDERSWVGRRVPRQEDARLVTGTGTFADDVAPPGTLHTAILRSPHAHARILGVDTTRARAMPGVAAAIAGEEAKAHWSPLGANFEIPGMQLPTAYGLAVGKVVYEGEPVAAVAAESRYLAEDALEAIEVAYEPLEPVLEFDASDCGWADAGAARRPLVYDEWTDNVQFTWDFAFGDVAGAFEAADVVVRERVAVHRYGAMPLEPRAVVAEFDPGTRALTVRASTQVPHQMRSQYARISGCPSPPSACSPPTSAAATAPRARRTSTSSRSSSRSSPGAR